MLENYKVRFVLKKKDHHQTLPEVPCMGLGEQEARVDGGGEFPLVEDCWVQGIILRLQSLRKQGLALCLPPFLFFSHSQSNS